MGRTCLTVAKMIGLLFSAQTKRAITPDTSEHEHTDAERPTDGI